jgi:hypothetical protein
MVEKQKGVSWHSPHLRRRNKTAIVQYPAGKRQAIKTLKDPRFIPSQDLVTVAAD